MLVAHDPHRLPAGRLRHRAQLLDDQGPTARARRLSGWTSSISRIWPGEIVVSARGTANRQRQRVSWAFTVASRADVPGSVGAPVHDDVVTDDEPAPATLRDRLSAAGLSDERIEQHMSAGPAEYGGARGGTACGAS